MAISKDIWIRGGPKILVEGAAPAITIAFDGVTTVAASPTVEIYKDGSSTDTVTTYMTSGSISVSGNTLTTQKLKDLVPGKYVIVFNATVDGVLLVWKLGLVVQKQEALW